MRNYTEIDKHLDSLREDIYPQPVDEGHTDWATTAIDEMMPEEKVESVLDVGCGEGFCAPIFEKIGVKWFGVTLGDDDFAKAHTTYPDRVMKGDFTFLGWLKDEGFDMIFARHALEHSPMPLITLMEWHRVASRWLLLIAPAPEYWLYKGKNHYAVMNQDQISWLLKLSGWLPVLFDTMTTFHEDYVYHFAKGAKKDKDGKIKFPPSELDVEYRYLCRKVEPRRE